MDGLIAGDFPRELDTATVKSGQNLERGSVLGREDGTPASKTASNDGPYNLNDKDDLVIDVDNGGDETATFNASAAEILDTTSYPVADQDGKYIEITITGGEYDGEVQRVDFSGVTTTAASIVDQINENTKGMFAKENAGQVNLFTDGEGTDYDIAVGVGDSNLTWGSSTPGSGDVGDINNVSVAEVKAVIEAEMSGVTVTPVGDSFKIESNSVGPTSELDFKSSDCLAKFGFSIEVINGTDGSGYWILCDKDATTGAEDPAGVLADDCDATSAEKNAPIYRTGDFDAAKLIFESGTTAADMKEAMAAKSMYQKNTSDMV